MAPSNAVGEISNRNKWKPWIMKEAGDANVGVDRHLFELSEGLL
jgi:hypothetical protein